MSTHGLPDSLLAAMDDRTSGATIIARRTIDGLLEVVDDEAALRDAADLIEARLPWYAPIWHIARAARGRDAAPELRRLRDDLERDTERTIAAAAAWLGRRPGGIATAPSSSIVARIVTALGDRARSGEPRTGLAGADAIGPTAVLNIVGTRRLAQRLPTMIATTSIKLVPEAVFVRLGSPAFERIPLDRFEAVCLDGEIVDVREAGRRAAQIEA